MDIFFYHGKKQKAVWRIIETLILNKTETTETFNLCVSHYLFCPMTDADVARFFQVMAPLSLIHDQAQLSTEMSLQQDRCLFLVPDLH